MNFDSLKLSTKIRYTKDSINCLKKQILMEVTSELPTWTITMKLGQKLKEKQELLKKLELELEESLK